MNEDNGKITYTQQLSKMNRQKKQMEAQGIRVLNEDEKIVLVNGQKKTRSASYN
jgi:hypothetical protein